MRKKYYMVYESEHNTLVAIVESKRVAKDLCKLGSTADCIYNKYYYVERKCK